MTTYKTKFTFKNQSNFNIKNIQIDNWDTYDFPDPVENPSQLTGKSLAAQKEISIDLELREGAKGCPFDITVIFQDNTWRKFTVFQRDAYSKNRGKNLEIVQDFRATESSEPNNPSGFHGEVTVALSHDFS